MCARVRVCRAGRWLPLFYVPSLVVLPLAVAELPQLSLLKVIVLVAAGWLGSLMLAVRRAARNCTCVCVWGGGGMYARTVYTHNCIHAHTQPGRARV